MSSRARLLLCCGIVTAIAYLLCLQADADAPVLRSALKGIPVMLMALWLAPWREREARLVALGLTLSAIGDICLESSPEFFLAGLSAFIAAHLGYLAAFLRYSRRLAIIAAIPVIGFCFGTFLWLQPYLGAMTLPVLGYLVVICAMMWRAWALVADESVARPLAWSAALGASSFGLSDTLVAHNRFIAPVPTFQLLLMLLYWAGQWGIAVSQRATRSI